MRCSLVVRRVSPNIAPLAYMSQCGAPSPANAGTTITPSASGTFVAKYSASAGVSRIFSPSRSHCIAAPAMNMLPSRAYVICFPFIPHAMVVSSPFCDCIGLFPVFMSMKHPVP